MKKNNITWIIIAMMFVVGFLSTSVSAEKITAEEAKKMMDSSKTAVILDVRTEAEYKAARIDGAILIPHDKIANLAEEKLPNKDETILVYCRSGRRSAIAAAKLTELGYKNVYDFGGINSWKYGTVKD